MRVKGETNYYKQKCDHASMKSIVACFANNNQVTYSHVKFSMNYKVTASMKKFHNIFINTRKS